MSALAARRAAQAAQATPLVTAASPKAAVKLRSPSPTPSVTDLLSSDSEAGPSKRRKVSKKNARYFAPEEDAETDEPTTSGMPGTKRSRRFSPSAPASDAEDGVDSSDDSSAEKDVDEGRADWTVPSTPRLEAVASVSKTGALSSVSRFKAVTGVNFQLLSTDTLDDCGIEGSGQGVVLSLSRQDSIMLAGIYTVQPLQGSVDLLSTTASPSTTPTPVFAPSSHPVPIITPSATTTRRLPSSLLSKLPLPSTFQLAESRTIFLVREYDCGLQGLKGGIVPGFSNIWGEERGSWGLRGVNPVTSSTSTLYPHITPESWVEPLRTLSSSPETASEETDDDEETPPVALVKGPKRSGKSTFARAALNNLLNRYDRVAWLECDLGQGEFSPGGTVGLWILDRPVLGPPFTHPSIPDKAHYLGSFTPQTCSEEYIAAIQHLLTYYQYEVAHPLLASSRRRSNKVSSVVPLVVNTQGWVKGLGEELLRAIELASTPTHVFAFESPYEETVEMGAGWTSSPPPLDQPTTGRIYTLQSAPISPLLARHTPSDLRTLSMMTYLHSHLSPSKASTWDFSLPLLAIPPWQVDLCPSSSSLKRVIMSGESADSIDPSDLALALNGNIVALLEHTDQDPVRQTVFDPLEPPPGMEESTYLGLALIRAISPSADDQSFKIHLLTPLPLETSRRANTIVRNGAIELPLCGMMDWRYPNASDLAGVKWEEAPFLDVSGVVGVGGERRRFRRNLMRKGQ